MFKFLRVLPILALALTSSAWADTFVCTTFSGGLTFNATDFGPGLAGQDVMNLCSQTIGTNFYECQENVRCQDEFAPAPFPVVPYPVVPYPVVPVVPYPVVPYPVYPRPIYGGGYPCPVGGGFYGPHPFPGGGFGGGHPGFGGGFAGGGHPGFGGGVHPHDEASVDSDAAAQ